MIQNKTIKMLLILLKYNIPENIASPAKGLCDIVKNMRINDYITKDEHNHLFTYLKDNLPAKEFSGEILNDLIFCWAIGDRDSRIAWCNEHIDLNLF